MRSRRALLYMPGDEIKKIKKAITLGVDCVCMDLEDGVATNRKDQARATIKEALETLEFSASERLVRINKVGSDFEQNDLNSILSAKPDGIVIPKVETAEQIRWVSEQITATEIKHNWQIGGVCLLAIVETALGIINLVQIANADTRLQALIFGAEDLAADIGAIRTQTGWEIHYARSAVVLHAAAFNLQAIDIVNINFNDLERLRIEAEEGANMGFVGKQIIHPNQVAPVQEAFTPSNEAIQMATHLLESYRKHQDEGVGAFAIDGKMVDAPLIKMSEGVIARAFSAGKIDQSNARRLIGSNVKNFSNSK